MCENIYYSAFFFFTQQVARKFLHARRLTSPFPNWMPVYQSPSTASPGTLTSLETAPSIWCRPQEAFDSHCLVRSAISQFPCIWQRMMGFLLESSALTAPSLKFRCTLTSPLQPKSQISAKPEGLFSVSATVKRFQVFFLFHWSLICFLVPVLFK